MPAFDIDARLDAFCAWLGRHGVPNAETYRSLARGIYLLPGAGGDVAAEHVAQSVSYAKDSGSDSRTLGTLEWLGEQLLVFEDELKTLKRHTGAVPVLSDSDVSEAEESAARESEAAGDPARPESEPPELELPSELGGGEQPRGDEAASAGRLPPPRVLAAAGGGLLAVAALFFLLGGGEDAPGPGIQRPAPPRPGASAAAPPKAAPSGPALVELTGLQLAVALPEGWHAAPPPPGRNPIAAGAQLYRGDSASEPERTAWLSVLPLPAGLTGAQVSPETLAIMGELVSDGIGESMGDGYRPNGCAPAAAASTLICTASLEGDSDEMANVRVYVRFDDFRAVVAVFVTPEPPEPEPDGAAELNAEADQLVAAIRDTVPSPATAKAPAAPPPR